MKNKINLDTGGINERINYLEEVIGAMEDLQSILLRDETDFSEEYNDITNSINYWNEQLQELYNERESEANMEQEQYEYEMACMNAEFERSRIYEY